MNHRMVFFTAGKIISVEAVLLLIPSIISFIYKESCLYAFLITIGIALALGLSLLLLAKPKSSLIYAKEGFLSVALTWIVLSAIGALPFFISREIPSYVDAFFETVSGFTTTGASIIPNVEEISRGLLFWRSFTHWIGGMGVLVFVMAVIPNLSGRSIHIMRAEMPGPVIGKLVPRAKDTAKILYLIYIALTLINVVFLMFGGLSVYESFIYAFGTAGTGGFGIKGDSLASYSPYIQWVTTAFMLIFGINFNLYYLSITKKIKNAISSTELWVFLAIAAISTGIITINILPMFTTVSDAIRNAAFQTASIISTSGFATTDFNLWPSLSKGILLMLMFIGSCAGSTAGGLKISRVIIAIKTLGAEIKYMLHPRSVNSIQFESKQVEKSTVKSVSIYIVMYFVCLFAVFLLLCIEPFDLETNFTAAVTCFNNVGPGFSGVGPMSNFAAYSPFSKILLSFAMLLGRLEIFPLIIAFTPYAWSKK